MTSRSRRTFASALLLLVWAGAAYGQLPERSAYDEHYAPVTLRGLKDLRVSADVHVFMPEALVTPKLEIPEVRTRVEALLKRADIGYLTDAEAKQRPEAPVLSLDVVATGMDGHSYSEVMTLDLFQPVMVSASKVRITSATWSTSSTAIATNETPRESILANIDWIVFQFIKAFRQGNGKSVPKAGAFFDFGPSPDEPTEAERRPKGLPLSASQNGLQMTAWPSPVRPVVFAAIRNASPRAITHLTGYDFPPDWAGTVECRLSQQIFGGRHEDAWEGTVESQAFEIELPLKVPPRDGNR